jgi:hypothetical protein
VFSGTISPYFNDQMSRSICPEFPGNGSALPETKFLGAKCGLGALASTPDSLTITNFAQNKITAKIILQSYRSL